MTIKPYIGFNENEILSLYSSVGWSNYVNSPDMLKSAFDHSLCILGAYTGDKLMGIGRAVGDGCSILLIQDLLVLPEYQRQGVGRALMEAILACYPEVYQVQLVTDDTPKTTAFYMTLGFSQFSDLGCCGFMKV